MQTPRRSSDAEWWVSLKRHAAHSGLMLLDSRMPEEQGTVHEGNQRRIKGPPEASRDSASQGSGHLQHDDIDICVSWTMSLCKF